MKLIIESIIWAIISTGGVPTGYVKVTSEYYPTTYVGPTAQTECNAVKATLEAQEWTLDAYNHVRTYECIKPPI